MALLRRAAAEPGAAFSTSLALLRGRWYLLWYRLRGRRVRAGRQFKIVGSLKVRGPGEVIFGDRVTILGDATPFTYKPEARILVGNDVMMGSARFGCAREISIGDQCILADCSISDTDHHSAQANRRSPDAPIRILPVKIERNVWVARQAAVLPGCTVGENSVISHGAVVMRSFGPNIVIVGNPAKVAAPIPSGDVAPAGEQAPAVGQPTITASP